MGVKIQGISGDFKIRKICQEINLLSVVSCQCWKYFTSFRICEKDESKSVRTEVVFVRMVRPGQGVKCTAPGHSNVRQLFE